MFPHQILSALPPPPPHRCRLESTAPEQSSVLYIIELHWNQKLFYPEKLLSIFNKDPTTWNLLIFIMLKITNIVRVRIFVLICVSSSSVVLQFLKNLGRLTYRIPCSIPIKSKIFKISIGSQCSELCQNATTFTLNVDVIYWPSYELDMLPYIQFIVCKTDSFPF
jgi:hypothetical protein